jgi:arginyl-tRNA--protein-N-Asp/Glu arginylyltransferase
MSDGPHCPYPALSPPIRLEMVEGQPHPCSYLPGRTARTRAFYADRMPGELYHRFMDAGFRRSGQVVYQPVCSGCRRCMPIRVPVATFRASKSQRRCERRNADLLISIGRPVATDEKYALYRRYVTEWHGGEADHDRQEFEAFLYESPVETLEFCYRDPDGALLAVGICDVCAQSLSSVYFYHEPAHHKRGLGVYGAIKEIEFARRSSIPYYYLGYWVSGCRTMQYKSDYRPCEILHPDGVWRPPGDAETSGTDGQSGQNVRDGVP